MSAVTITPAIDAVFQKMARLAITSARWGEPQKQAAYEAVLETLLDAGVTVDVADQIAEIALVNIDKHALALAAKTSPGGVA